MMQLKMNKTRLKEKEYVSEIVNTLKVQKII